MDEEKVNFGSYENLNVIVQNDIEPVDVEMVKFDVPLTRTAGSVQIRLIQKAIQNVLSRALAKFLLKVKLSKLPCYHLLLAKLSHDLILSLINLPVTRTFPIIN